MYAYDIIGYVLDCDVYCLDCMLDKMHEDESASPVFAGDEDEHTCSFCYNVLGS